MSSLFSSRLLAVAVWTGLTMGAVGPERVLAVPVPPFDLKEVAHISKVMFRGTLCPYGTRAEIRPDHQQVHIESGARVSTADEPFNDLAGQLTGTCDVVLDVEVPANYQVRAVQVLASLATHLQGGAGYWAQIEYGFEGATGSPSGVGSTKAGDDELTLGGTKWTDVPCGATRFHVRFSASIVRVATTDAAPFLGEVTLDSLDIDMSKMRLGFCTDQP